MPITTVLRRATGVASALAATAALGLASAGPAAAETQKHQDPRGDVETLQFKQAHKPKPGIDVISLKNTFKGSKLTLSMTTVKLVKQGYIAEWVIDAGNDGTYVLILDNTTGDPQVQFVPTGSPIRRPGALRRGTPEVCNGVKVVAKKNTVTGTVPRSCMGGANAVSVAGLTGQLTQTSPKVDDSRQKGFGGIENLKFGPKLKRN